MAAALPGWAAPGGSEKAGWGEAGSSRPPPPAGCREEPLARHEKPLQSAGSGRPPRLPPAPRRSLAAASGGCRCCRRRRDKNAIDVSEAAAGGVGGRSGPARSAAARGAGRGGARNPAPAPLRTGQKSSLAAGL